MFNINVNNKFSYGITIDKDKTYADGREVNLDMINGMDNHLHILHNNQSYRAEIVTFSREEKSCVLKVNGNTYQLDIKDQFDELLQRLGLDNLNKVRIAELKAPMPGLVLKVLVSAGDEVKKGDNILVLEAMKMENIIKAPADVKIRAIKVERSDKVEKNQVMVLFE